MKVIVPCCGRSSRFPDQPPKWMLPALDGRPMLALAVAGLEVDLDDLVVVVLQDHVERFDAVEGVHRAFDQPVEVVVLPEPTASQADTIAQTLRSLGITEPFLVKDSDNGFRLDELLQPHNYVSVDSLNNHDLINPRNKSYLQVDHRGIVTNIREKVVVSDLFSVGGYFFTDPGVFLEHFDRLADGRTPWANELYLSDVIGSMILDGIPFRSRSVEHYEDWGTVHEWRRTMLERQAYLVLLDGFVFERGSEHFRPRFEEVHPNERAVAAVLDLVESGHQVRYLSIRPSSYRELTARQLTAAGLPEADILFDCPITAWTLVTAPHATLPVRTAHAVELDPADPNVLERLRDDA